MPKRPLHADFIALRLRALREQLDLTQEEFAEASGINYKVYQSYEAGRRWNLRFSTVLKLAALHQVSVPDFFSAAPPRSRFTPLVRVVPGRRRRRPAR